MGYDASVPCNCYRNGLAATPPCPVVWNEAEGLFELSPDVLDLKGRLWIEVVRWQENACAHPNMRAVSLRLGNISAMAEFRSAIRAIGSQNVLTLAEILPVANGGLVESGKAPAILRDLNRFEQLIGQSPCTGLIEVATGTSAFIAFPGAITAFMWTPDGNMGFDSEGLFVERGGVEIFRARHVRMHPGSGQRCDLEDVETGAVLHRAPYPALGADEWRVSPTFVGVNHFEDMIADLRLLFETSLAVSRPVYWS